MTREYWVPATLIGLLLLIAPNSVGWAQKRELTLRQIKQAVKENPHNPHVLYILGLKYEIDGNSQKALQAYQQALNLKGDYPAALFRLGAIKGEQGDWDEAVKALKKVIQLRPNYPDAKVTLGAVYGQMGLTLLEQGQWAEAQRDLQNAIENNPNDDAALNNLGVAYGKQNDWDLAIETFQAAIQVNPGNVEAHYNLGTILLLSGDKTGALIQYRNLVYLNSNLASNLFDKMSFPKGQGPYETPQWGATELKPSALRMPTPAETIPSIIDAIEESLPSSSMPSSSQ